MEGTALTRRSLLAGSLTLVVPVAGCSEETTGDERAVDPDETTDLDDLDLQEANVVGVAADRDGDSVTFDVTLHHDDDGEDGYADWWQVETRDGDRLGRRDLAHPHSDQPFTRSTTIDVPQAVDCVVVRGHDQTHDYGGQAMLVTLDGVETRRVQQGAEPDGFESESCP